MATPTVAEKRLMAAAVKKGATWGTAVALGATDGLYLESDGGLKLDRPYVQAVESNNAFPRTGIWGPNNPVDFAPTFNMRYDPGGLALLIAQFMGTAGAPSDLTGAYKHTFQFADYIFGLFSTFAYEKRAKIYEVPSCKPYGLNFSFTDGMLKGAINLRGDDLKDDSAVNTLTQMDAVTYDDAENVVAFTHGTVKMNDESGAAVSAETALEVSDFTVEFARSLNAPNVVGQSPIIEPNENGRPSAKITLNFPRQSAINAAYFAEARADTAKKVEIKFTGALITGANYYDFAMQFPNLVLSPMPEYPWDEVIPANIQLLAEESSAAPTGMTYTRPYMELINLQATDYLA